MLKNWFLITAASFGVGFGVTLVYLRTPVPSIIAGAAGASGAISGVLLCAKQRQEELERQTQSTQVTVNILTQQEKTLEKQLQAHQDNRQTIQHQVNQLEQQMAGLQSQQQGQEASIAKFDRELDAKRLEMTSLTAEITGLQQQQNAAQAALLDLQNIEAEITIYSATKTQLLSEVTRLEEYQTDIKTQIADDKDTCEKAEEYLIFVSQEVNDKQADLLELNSNIKSKVTELNICRQQLAELSQQKTEAESVIKQLAIELPQTDEAILPPAVSAAQLVSDIPSPTDICTPTTETDLPLLETPSAESLAESAEFFAVQEESGLDFMDYLDSMDSLPDLAASGLQLADYLPIQEPESFSDLLADAGSESAEPTTQFVEFQPQGLSISDLEETSPISASAFSELCDMNDISVEPLELGLLDIADLGDMTLDQDSAEYLNISDLDLNDITLEQKPLNSSAVLTNNVSASPDWSKNLVDSPYLAVLSYIEQHGSIEHFEVVAMLNDKKLARQFAIKLSAYADLLPFAIDIITTKNGNRYQKRALVLSAI
jgi:hypothetical protein